MSKQIQLGERVIGSRTQEGVLAVIRVAGIYLGRRGGLALVALPKGIVLECNAIRRAK